MSSQQAHPHPSPLPEGEGKKGPRHRAENIPELMGMPRGRRGTSPRSTGFGALDRAHLIELLKAEPPLVEGLLDPGTQLQPNGIDLTLRAVAWYASPGQLGVTNDERVLARVDELEFDPEGWVHLAPGPYLATLNETLHVPLGLTGLTWPRSSLLRSGVAVHTAVGDAGYEGSYQVLLSVLNPRGFRIARNARIVQEVFFTLVTPVSHGYAGIYQQSR